MNCLIFLELNIFIFILLFSQEIRFSIGNKLLKFNQSSTKNPAGTLNVPELDFMLKDTIETEDDTVEPPNDVQHDETEAEKYPFMVSIQTKFPMGTFKHLCGGSIIDKQFVITTAHCTLKPKQLFAKDLYVLAGSNRINDKIGKRFRVKAMKIHPLFVPLKGHDILLLQVEPQIPIGKFGYSIIDYRNTTRQKGGLEATLLGWGRVNPKKPKSLERIAFQTIDDSECYKNYKFKYLTDSEICAKNSEGPRGACDGDSGGPLIDTNGHYIYGMLSYGRVPCEKGKPFAFTRINVYVKWIEEQIKVLKQH